MNDEWMKNNEWQNAEKRASNSSRFVLYLDSWWFLGYWNLIRHSDFGIRISRMRAAG
jgi:hypothetical protein